MQFHFCGSNVWLLLTSPLMSEWVTLSSDRAATSPHSAVWLHEGEIQASDANPVSPSSQDPSSPRRGGLVGVTCHSQPPAFPAASKRRMETNVSLKNTSGSASWICQCRTFSFWYCQMKQRKMVVRGQNVELGSTEMRVFIWSAELSPWVYPDADWTSFQAMYSLTCAYAFPLLP